MAGFTSAPPTYCPRPCTAPRPADPALRGGQHRSADRTVLYRTIRGVHISTAHVLPTPMYRTEAGRPGTAGRVAPLSTGLYEGSTSAPPTYCPRPCTAPRPADLALRDGQHLSVQDYTRGPHQHCPCTAHARVPHRGRPTRHCGTDSQHLSIQDYTRGPHQHRPRTAHARVPHRGRPTRHCGTGSTSQYRVIRGVHISTAHVLPTPVYRTEAGRPGTEVRTSIGPLR